MSSLNSVESASSHADKTALLAQLAHLFPHLDNMDGKLPKADDFSKWIRLEREFYESHMLPYWQRLAPAYQQALHNHEGRYEPSQIDTATVERLATRIAQVFNAPPLVPLDFLQETPSWSEAIVWNNGQPMNHANCTACCWTLWRTKPRSCRAGLWRATFDMCGVPSFLKHLQSQNPTPHKRKCCEIDLCVFCAKCTKRRLR